MMVDKLLRLQNACKASVYVSINEHRSYYETVTERLLDLEGRECPAEIPDDIAAEMIKKDTIVEVQFYPDTPIGSYSVFHYDLDKCLDACLEIIQREAE